MPVLQKKIDFPVRKSSRKRILKDKENEENKENKECQTGQRKPAISPEKSLSSPLRTKKTQELTVSGKENSFHGTSLSSPSKRKGDNVCAYDCSPKKIVNITATVPVIQLSSVSKSPRKSLSAKFTECTRKKVEQESNAVVRSSTSPNKDSYAVAKKALNTQQPDSLVGRDSEIEHITQFLDKHIKRNVPGSLYISGAPGTGKTAVVKHLITRKYAEKLDIVFINSMTVKSAYGMYKAIANELLGKKSQTLKNAKSACLALERYLTTRGTTVLLVLDEMDQLDSKHQEVLYTIFEWPSLPKSRLVLIGIANAFDLTDRILPRLHAKSECKPELLNFTPYNKDQIISVIESRLSETPEVAAGVLDKSAIMFCARKVSAVAGDMRKALDICRRSIEISELSERKQKSLKLKGSTGDTIEQVTASTQKTKVGIMQVANVIDEVYGSASKASHTSTFPLQQKLIACTLLLMLKSSKLKEQLLGKVHDAYCKVCKRRDVSATDQSEFLALCQLLEARGILTLKRAKQTRLSKISLNLDAQELEHALQDKLLISSVLEGHI